jgi:cytochrome c oxidase subunit 2
MNGAGRQALCALAVAATLTSCDGIQSMTGGDGFHGQQFIGLFALFMGVTGLFYVAVALFLAVSLLRVHRAPQDRRTDPGRPGPGRAERGLMRALLGWTGLILVGLSVLTIGSYLADRNSARAAAAPAKLKITITAHQWWWEVEYQDPSPFNIFRTANELHLPRGIPVDITLRSDDVIHSFWAPNLAGKQDLIPGRSGEIRLIASHDGLYRAECAEFCGVQHAHMALDVTVQSPVEFTAWTDSRRAPAAAPESSLAAAGQDYFMKRECAACHSISGTSARGSIGPDLTHFAGRRSIAAGTYPMTRGHLYGWVADPQSAKPGNRMPVLALNAAELHALVAYLETLR